MYFLTPRLSIWALLGLTILGAIRIVLSGASFSQTYDEPAHIACGMEWLDKHTYTLETQHPPLARVAGALGPYLLGLRLPGGPEVAAKAAQSKPSDLFTAAGNIILNQADYARTLRFARLGILPFFLLSCWMLWKWSCELFGKITALASVGVFTNLPFVLAHAGLATTDFCFTATFLLAIYAFSRWLRLPTLKSALLQGFCLGLAILSKFSVFLFFPTAALSILLIRWMDKGDHRLSALLPSRLRIRTLIVSLVACSLTVWAGYRFSVASIVNPHDQPHQNIARLLAAFPRAVRVANFLVETPIPNPELYRGLVWLSEHAREGNPAYLLGEVRQKGFWYFFPITIFMKTPLPVLILIEFGCVSLMAYARPPERWQAWIPLAVCVPILTVCMVSTINLGIRHILPIFTFVSMIAGVGLARLIAVAKGSRWRIAIPVALSAWLIVSSVGSHPNYLSYFNELAGKSPENILVESDLDWGQDIPSLREELLRRHVDHFSIAYFGTTDLARQGLPQFQELKPYEHRSGWVAISLALLEVGGRPQIPDNSSLQFGWLKSYQPCARVGGSILLFNIPD